MSSLKLRALAGVCALMSAAGLGASAHAQTTTTISGGGSTLLGPYWAQAVLCYDNDTGNRTYLTKGIPAAPTTTLATTVSGCPHNKGNLIQYDATGSGTGQAGVFAHAAVIQDVQAGVTTLMFGSQDAAGTIPVYPSIQYGLSDNSLVNSDLAVYNAGTGGSYVVPFNGNAQKGQTVVGASSYQGLTFDTSGTSTGGASGTDYPIPVNLYGPLVQFPASIDPVAITFNGTYVDSTGATQAFNIGNGGVLHLDSAAYCGIFTGSITDWNDPALTALNGASLTNGNSVLIKLVGRSDSSGTTSIFTRHLAAVCGGATYTAGVTTLPSAVVNTNQANGNFVAGEFNTANGSGGVAGVVETTAGALAYIGADYVIPASTATGATPGFQLPAAALKNNAGAFELPTGATALAAFGALLPPQTDSTGAYNADPNTSRSDPTQWVQGTQATVALAKPTAAGAYPIVGTTNFIGYTCYANAAQLTTLKNFLTFGGGTVAGAILNNAALGQLPSSSSSVPNTWLNAINNTFLESNGDAAALHLFFDTAGDTATGANPACSVSGVVGG